MVKASRKPEEKQQQLQKRKFIYKIKWNKMCNIFIYKIYVFICAWVGYISVHKKRTHKDQSQKTKSVWFKDVGVLV